MAEVKVRNVSHSGKGEALEASDRVVLNRDHLQIGQTLEEYPGILDIR